MNVPLIAEVDLLITGAGLAGMALAEKSAKNGKKVLLIEGRTYLGYEIGAWYRPWINNIDPKNKDLIRHWLPDRTERNQKEEITFTLDKCKLRFEDILLEAGVTLLYAVHPVALWKEEDIFHLIIGAKSGLYEIKTRSLVDATVNGLLSSISPLRPEKIFRCGKGQAVIRCLEVEGLEIEETAIHLPERYCLRENRLLVHRSAFARENRILEFSFLPQVVTDDEKYPDAMLRMKTIEICEELFSRPGWQKVRFGASSAEYMPVADFDIAESLRTGDKLVETLFDLATLSGRSQYAAAGYTVSPSAETVSPAESAFFRDDPELSLYCSGAAVGSDHVKRILTAAKQERQRDVFVCGAGVSGATAAYAAAEYAEDVAAADMNSIPGGTGTAGAVHFYWYGRRKGFTKEIDDEYFLLSDKLGQKREQYIWGDRDGWNPELKASVLQERFRRRKITFFPQTIACGVFRRGNRLEGILLAGPHGPIIVPAKITLDTTGDADIAVMAGAPVIEGSEKDNMIMWSNLAQYRQAGRNPGGTFTSTADVGDIWDYTRFILLSRRRGENCHDHGSYLATRESRHLEGEYIITLRDILMLRQYPDTILRCYSNYDSKGKSWADIIYFGYLPSQIENDVPYRSVLPKNIEGLMVGGKAFSCTHDALPGPRMQDDMQNFGGALGIAAAMAAKEGSVRHVNIDLLREKLIASGALDEKPLRPDTANNNPEFYSGLINGLNGDEALETIAMDINETCRDIPPVVRICLAHPEEVLGYLRTAYEKAGSSKNLSLLLARLLLWHRDDYAIDRIIAEIEAMLAEETLPKRKGSVKYTMPYPDHGVMAEISYLVCLLARSKNEKVPGILEKIALRIRDAPRDYMDRTACIFNHIESVAYVACRRPDPSLISSLTILLGLNEFSNIEETGDARTFNPDITLERIAYLKILLAEALARCGNRNGYIILKGFLNDRRRTLAKSAERILEDILGAGTCHRIEPMAGLQEPRSLSGGYRFDVPPDPLPCKPYLKEIW